MSLRAVYQKTLQNLAPERLLMEAFRKRTPGSQVHILSLGKAAAPMACAAREAAGGKAWKGQGFLLTKFGHCSPSERDHLSSFTFWEAAHPIPDEAGTLAARDLLRWLESHPQSEELLVLLSGGASSLLADPIPPLNLRDLQELNEALLQSGLPIEEVNVVRKHLSYLKGGQLGARLTKRFKHITQYVLCDVSADLAPPHLLSLIGSGPTVPDPSTLEQARRILNRLDSMVPPSKLARWRDCLIETPKDLTLEATILADYHTLRATALGYLSESDLLEDPNWSPTVEGEVAKLAVIWGRLAKRLLFENRCGTLAATGEPTVRLSADTPKSHRGGRCQELALRFAREIDGVPGITLLAGSSDGTDGPTDYAGAMVDGTTWSRLKALVGEGALLKAVEQHNSTAVLEKLPEALLRTGPTGQNLNDLFLLSICESSSASE